jgi:adenylate cyclase
MKRKELSAAISFPIASKGKVLGVLNVSETKGDMQFSEADIEMLSIIVGQAMMALENIRSRREREENCRIRALLEQYVSPEVSNLLVKSKQNLLDVGGVQQLTVLFADIRNFTLLVQHLDPAQLRVFLNNFFDMFGRIVFSHQGMLDKFMGDAALVIFGAPVQIDSPNITAVSAAYQIMIEFENLRLIWEKKDRVFTKVGLGIGISRGPMFLGNVGSSQRFDYTVIGPDVNIAQRLASVTESGQILITDRVQATLNGRFPVKAEKNMLLKGMEAEVSVYSLSVKDIIQT